MVWKSRVLAALTGSKPVENLILGTLTSHFQTVQRREVGWHLLLQARSLMVRFFLRIQYWILTIPPCKTIIDLSYDNFSVIFLLFPKNLKEEIDFCEICSTRIFEYYVQLISTLRNYYIFSSMRVLEVKIFSETECLTGEVG